MTDYNWQDFREADLSARFPDWATGLEQWRAQSTERELKAFRYTEELQPPKKPRVFISHKRQDEDIAIAISRIAKNSGFEVWLDVLDPVLRAPEGFPRRFTASDRSLLIANIIEIALINCTHVVAIMTPNTRTSRWVPYEYGRVRDDDVLSSQASAYLYSLSKEDLPEYMHLGTICEKVEQHKLWLLRQRIGFIGERLAEFETSNY